VAYRDLRDFVHKLGKEDELQRVSAEVDPILEITEVTDRVVKAAGPALLFEHPKGSTVPAVTNLLGSERRMCLALEADSLDQVAERVHSFLDVKSPQGILEKVKMLPKLAEIGSFSRDRTQRRLPGNGSHGEFFARLFPYTEVLAAGRRALYHVAHGDHEESGNGERNVGCYRMQVYDERTTGMHWQTQKQEPNISAAPAQKTGKESLR